MAGRQTGKTTPYECRFFECLCRVVGISGENEASFIVTLCHYAKGMWFLPHVHARLGRTHWRWWRGWSCVLELVKLDVTHHLCSTGSCSTPMGLCTCPGAGWVSPLRGDSPKRTMQRAPPPEGKRLALAKQLSTLLLRTFLRSILTHKWIRWGKKKRWFPAIWFRIGGESSCRTEPQSWKERRRGLCVFQGGPAGSLMTHLGHWLFCGQPQTATPGVPTTNRRFFPPCTTFMTVFKILILT